MLSLTLNGSAYTLQFDPAQNYSGHAFSVVNSNGVVAIVDPLVSSGGIASSGGVPLLHNMWDAKSFASSLLGLPAGFNATSESTIAVTFRVLRRRGGH